MKKLDVEKELMRMVANGNNVPDATIDRARLAIVKNARVNRKPRHIYITNLVKFAICIIILFSLSVFTIQASISRSSKYKPTINYDELFKNPIQSVEDFNIQCDTKYRYLRGFDVTKAYNLTEGLVSMVIEEHYQTEDAVITLYVADKSVVIDKFIDYDFEQAWNYNITSSSFLYKDFENSSYIFILTSFKYYIVINYLDTGINHQNYMAYVVNQLQ